MIETQLSFSAPITLNNNTGLGLATKKAALSNHSDSLTTCLQQQRYFPSEPMLPDTVSFVKNPSESTIIGILIERISMLDAIISKLDSSAKKQLESIVEKTNQAYLAIFGSKKLLKMQEDRVKKWENIHLKITIAAVLLQPTILLHCSVLLNTLSLAVYVQKNLQKRELLQLKAKDILLMDQMKGAETQQASLHKKHKDGTSNLLENMFLMGNNV